MFNHGAAANWVQLIDGLWDGYCRYRAATLGTDISALTFQLPWGDSEPGRFHRPKIGFVVLSEDRVVSPGLIFNQTDRDIVVEYVEPQRSEHDEAFSNVEYLCGINRLQVLMILTPIRAPKRSLGSAFRNFLAIVLGKPRSTPLAGYYDAILRSHRARKALETRPSVREAVGNGTLIVLESLFDAESRELHFDVSGKLLG